MAFGEVLFDEHLVNPKQPYLFNGKELDFETGIYYYGARYYDPKVSLWLNVDPLAEKYPYISPYTYTFNNPIKYIDPDGRDPITGIADAASSFAIDVGMDFLGGVLIEGKSFRQSYNDIGWWSAGINAVGAYAISAVTPTGTATSAKIAKLMANKKLRATAEIVGAIAGKMATKAIDKYSQGKYDDENGNFSIDNVSMKDLFIESTVEALIEKGLGGKADEFMKELGSQNKIIDKKFKLLQQQSANNASKKRIKSIVNDINNLRNKNSETMNKYLKEKVKTGTASKIINNEIEKGNENK